MANIVDIQLKLKKSGNGLKQVTSETEALSDSLSDVNKNTKESDSSTKEYSQTLNKFGSTASTAVKATAGLAAAITATAAAIATAVVNSGKATNELSLLAKQAKLTSVDFQALAFATQQFGVSQEQIADISKDLFDRLGEFSTAGTGTFQDFADVVGLTTKEAKELASEFSTLSSDEVIGQIVKRLEEANASGAQMTFVLESLGNDLSKLVPLFSDNSKGLDDLTKKFLDVNETLALTNAESKQLRESSRSFDLLAATATNAGAKISASLSKVVTDVFERLIEIVPQATNDVVNFINSFKEIDELNTQSSIEKRMSDIREEASQVGIALSNIEAEIESLDKATGSNLMSNYFKGQVDRAIELKAQLKTLNDEFSELNKQSEKLEFQELISGVGATQVPTQSTGFSDIQNKEAIKAIENRFKTEEELLKQKLNEDLKSVGENIELRKQLENAYNNDILKLNEKRLLDQEKQNEDSIKNQIKETELLLGTASLKFDQGLISKEEFEKEVLELKKILEENISDLNISESLKENSLLNLNEDVTRLLTFETEKKSDEDEEVEKEKKIEEIRKRRFDLEQEIRNIEIQILKNKGETELAEKKILESKIAQINADAELSESEKQRLISLQQQNAEISNAKNEIQELVNTYESLSLSITSSGISNDNSETLTSLQQIIDKVKDLEKEYGITEEASNNLTNKQIENNEKSKESYEDLAESWAESTVDLLKTGVSSIEEFEQAFIQMLLNIVEASLQASLQQAFSQLLGGGGSGGGGGSSDLGLISDGISFIGDLFGVGSLSSTAGVSSFATAGVNSATDTLGATTAATAANAATQAINITNLVDPDSIVNALESSPTGENYILNVVANNPDTVSTSANS